jgi:hypothetical protein
MHQLNACLRVAAHKKAPKKYKNPLLRSDGQAQRKWRANSALGASAQSSAVREILLDLRAQPQNLSVLPR